MISIYQGKRQEGRRRYNCISGRPFLFGIPMTFIVFIDCRGNRPERRIRFRMNRGKYIVLTNNPLVFDKLEKTHEVIYLETTYEGLLREVRDRIHYGHLLLTHPLSGSVKPNETPYKSVLISAGKEEVDRRSLTIIENAIDACHKFQDKTGRYGESVLEDFQLIDWTLLESGLASADAW